MCLVQETCWQWGVDTHACARADNATEMGPMSHKPHPLQQRAADSLARKKWKIPWNFFSHSKVVLPAVPAMFFFTKIFRTFFHCVARGFFDGFSRFFSHIFSHYFSHGFSRRIFRTSLLHIFLTHFFVAVCCPKGFHSLKSQHCVTVPETGHTTTCRSSPSLLTQYSHKQVEKIKSFWKDKRQIFTLQTIRHNKSQCSIAFSCLGNRYDFWSPRWVNRKHRCDFGALSRYRREFCCENQFCAFQSPPTPRKSKWLEERLML